MVLIRVFHLTANVIHETPSCVVSLPPSCDVSFSLKIKFMVVIKIFHLAANCDSKVIHLIAKNFWMKDIVRQNLYHLSKFSLILSDFA